MDVTVIAAPAVFDPGGPFGTCTTVATSGGIYAAGSPFDASNKLWVSVHVTTVGSYSINTSPVNGVTFNGVGMFTTTGTQFVTLTGSGTPTAAGLITHVLNTGTNTCNFTIPYN